MSSRRKNIRERGKLQLSRYFRDIKEGERVAVVIEKSVKSSFPERIQGRTGVIINKRGKAYLVEIKDQNKDKKFLIEPIHLKKIK